MVSSLLSAFVGIFFCVLMIRRPPRSTRTEHTLSLHDALPISAMSTFSGFCCALCCMGNDSMVELLRWATTHPASATAVLVLLDGATKWRSEEHTSELQSLMRISYAVFCLKKKKKQIQITKKTHRKHTT